MFSGKTMIGVALGIFAASAYYRAKGRVRKAMAAPATGRRAADGRRMIEDIAELRRQLSNTRTMVHKLGTE